MTTNNTLRLLLLLLCLATILTSVSSCDKDIDKPMGNSPSSGYTIPDAPDYWFSRVKYFKDNRKPATDTIWTLHLVTQIMVDQYTNQDGYLYTETSTYTELGTLWTKKK